MKKFFVLLLSLVLLLEFAPFADARGGGGRGGGGRGGGGRGRGGMGRGRGGRDGGGARTQQKIRDMQRKASNRDSEETTDRVF